MRKDLTSTCVAGILSNGSEPGSLVGLVGDMFSVGRTSCHNSYTEDFIGERTMARKTPCVKGDRLTFCVGENGVDEKWYSMTIGGSAWQDWLKQGQTFRFESEAGCCTVCCQRVKGNKYWHAQCTVQKKTYSEYLGKADHLTLPCLERVTVRLLQRAQGINTEPVGCKVDTVLVAVSEALPVEPVVFELPCPDTPQESLTPTEQAIVLAIREGCSNQQIAERLEMAVNTVKWYLRRIYVKLGVSSRTQAVHHAMQLELLSMNVVGQLSTS